MGRVAKRGFKIIMGWLVASCLASCLARTANCTSFEECYFTCLGICAITPGVSFSDCPFRCLQACIVPSYPIDHINPNPNPNPNHLFCHLGCAVSSCANFSTIHNPAEKKVGSCVDSCSRTCSKI